MDRLSYQLTDGVAAITLDDGKVNALGPDMQAEIHGALDRAEADDAVVVLSGRPGMFSAGFDLKTLRGGGQAAVDMFLGGFRLAYRFLSFPRPIIVGCTGHAMAMGAFLMLSADYRIGPQSGAYKWVANEVAIGLTMPWTAIEIMRVRLTPPAFDRGLNLSATFGPDDAVASGFFDRLVPEDEVLAAATEYARAATALDAKAHTATKLRTRAQALAALENAINRDEAELLKLLAAAG